MMHEVDAPYRAGVQKIVIRKQIKDEALIQRFSLTDEDELKPFSDFYETQIEFYTINEENDGYNLDRTLPVKDNMNSKLFMGFWCSFSAVFFFSEGEGE